MCGCKVNGVGNDDKSWSSPCAASKASILATTKNHVPNCRFSGAVSVQRCRYITCLQAMASPKSPDVLHCTSGNMLHESEDSMGLSLRCRPHGNVDVVKIRPPPSLQFSFLLLWGGSQKPGGVESCLIFDCSNAVVLHLNAPVLHVRDGFVTQELDRSI